MRTFEFKRPENAGVGGCRCYAGKDRANKARISDSSRAAPHSST